METIWIIGSGKFGLRAAKTLSRDGGRRQIVVVDKDRSSLEAARHLGCETIEADGVGFLFKHLKPGSKEGLPDWIIPAVPVHLAWEWAERHLQGLGRKSLAEGLEAGLPNAMRGASGDIYVSHADFLCPPNCNEPDEFCTKTGEPRKKDMFRLIKDGGLPGMKAFVIRSRQLGPGVGGYRPEALLDLAAELRHHQGPLAVATACRCHGVITPGALTIQI